MANMVRIILDISEELGEAIADEYGIPLDDKKTLTNAIRDNWYETFEVEKPVTAAERKQRENTVKKLRDTYKSLGMSEQEITAQLKSLNLDGNVKTSTDAKSAPAQTATETKSQGNANQQKSNNGQPVKK